LAQRLEGENVSCSRRSVEGGQDVAGAVLSVAAEVGATMIVMGISGKSPFARHTSGDIPSQLLSRTTLPVLLLPPAVDVEI